MALEWRFGGLWVGLWGGVIEELKNYLSQPGRPEGAGGFLLFLLFFVVLILLAEVRTCMYRHNHPERRITIIP